MNLPYLILRTIRHFMPEELTRFMLRRGIFIRPGLETRDPQTAMTSYVETLRAHGLDIQGKRVLILGYGGNYAVGVGLLSMGAEQVSLCERFAPPDDTRNQALLAEHHDLLTWRDGRVIPQGDRLRLVHGDIRELSVTETGGPFDYTFSAHVYEHLDDVPGITKALHSQLDQQGVLVAFVDLRDHYFKYPYEMLTFSKAIWTQWLNPTSNLNRYRVRDYQKVFEEIFARIEIQVRLRDKDGFLRTKSRIRPEFLTGDDEQDSICKILITAFK